MVEQRSLESEQKMANSADKYNDVFRSGNKHSQPAATPVVNTPAPITVPPNTPAPITVPPNTPAPITVPPKVSTPKLRSSPTHHALRLRHAGGQLQDTFPIGNYSTPGVVADYASNFINTVLPPLPPLQSNYATPGVVADYANNFLTAVLPSLPPVPDYANDFLTRILPTLPAPRLSNMNPTPTLRSEKSPETVLEQEQEHNQPSPHINDKACAEEPSPPKTATEEVNSFTADTLVNSGEEARARIAEILADVSAKQAPEKPTLNIDFSVPGTPEQKGENEVSAEHSEEDSLVTSTPLIVTVNSSAVATPTNELPASDNSQSESESESENEKENDAGATTSSKRKLGIYVYFFSVVLFFSLQISCRRNRDQC
jgi:hypothetical protein